MSTGMPCTEPAEVQEATATSTVTFADAEPKNDYQSEHDTATKVRSGFSTKRPSERTDVDLSPQISTSSKSIRLEPPPLVMKPPKVKSDGFSSTALSWFAWSSNEEKDILACARALKHSYSRRTTFRLLGFSFSRDISYKTSATGFDTAMVNVRVGWGKSEASWIRDMLPRVRKRFGTYSQNDEMEGADEERQEGMSQDHSSTTAVEDQKASKQPGHGVPHRAHRWLNDYYYVVVGLTGDHSAPKENLRRVMRIDELFQQIRKAHRHLRNPIRRAISMKEVAGFGIYQCHPSKGHHTEVLLDSETAAALAELWRSYNTHKLDWEGRWLMWIHQHFNNSSKNPEKGTLTLELKLRWSVFKVCFWGVVPILLSLAVGFWYMYSDHGEVDGVAVTEAAWVVATYITTTSALIFALLAVITQLGDV